MKLRYCFFVLFFALCVYGIVVLNDEGSELTYVVDERLEKLKFETGISFVCSDLKDILKERTSIDFDQLQETAQTHFTDLNGRLEAEESKKFGELILNQIGSGDYVILKKSKLCFNLSAQQLPQQYPGLYQLKEDSFGLAKLDLARPAQGVAINDEYQHSTCNNQDVYSRFNCMNNCLQVGNGSWSYVQFSNSTGVIELNAEKDAAFLKAEQTCARECKTTCKLVYHFPSGTSLEAFRSEPTVGRTEYWLKFFRLIYMILGITFYGLLYKSIKKMASLKLEEEALKIHKLNIKVGVISITVIILFVLWGCMVADYGVSSPKVKRINMHQIRTGPSNLVICIPVENILTNDYLGNTQAEPYKGMSFLELEEKTDSGLRATLEGVYLDYSGKETKIDPVATPKVLFKADANGNLFRCFHLQIGLTEPRYQTLLGVSKLKIKFEHSLHSVYWLSPGEKFTTESFQYSGGFAVVENITIRQGKEVVFDLDEDFDRCNRRAMIEKCVQNKLLKKEAKISISSDLIVDKDQFTDQIWRSGYQEANQALQTPALTECKSNFAAAIDRSCAEIQFINGDQTGQSDGRVLSLDLHFESVLTTEYDPALCMVLVNMTNLLIIFFGPIIFNLLMAFAGCCTSKDNQIPLIIICAICSLGFFSQAYSIFSEAIAGDYIADHYFEHPEQMQSPNIIFCFEITEERESNGELTGNQLEEATKEISVETVFSSISYRTEANTWKAADLGDQKEFQVNTFYLANRKCFSFEMNLLYDRSLLLFDDNRVLKVNFNRSFVEERPPYLMTRIQKTMQFSKIVALNYKRSDEESSLWPSFSLEQEFRREIYYEPLGLLKHPLSLFYAQKTPINDVDAYIRRLVSDFKGKTNNNITSLSLPVERDQFDLRINDTLFDQFIVERNKTELWAPTNPNFDREYAVNHLRKSLLPEANGPDFEYGMIFLRRLTIETTRCAYGTLLLDLLLAASFWFDLSAIGLFPTISDSLDHFHSKVSN